MQGIATPIINGKKVCSHCKEPKPIEEFVERRKTRKNEYNYSYGREYGTPHSDQFYFHRDPRCNLCRREYYQTRRYGLTEAQFKTLTQANKCALCNSDGSTHPKGLHVDHDHTTGVIRGLLCNECNWVVGWLEKSSVTVGAAQCYLAGNHLNMKPEAPVRTAFDFRLKT